MSDGEKLGRVVQFDRYGGVEMLRIRMLARPTPGPREVLVRVHAAALNPKDTLIRSGALRIQTGRAFPRGTGFDLSGEVVANGTEVVDLPIGRRVWGFLDGAMGGAAADYVVVPREWLSSMPEQLGWVEGAALPLVGSAALQALKQVARLQPGERLLIQGASGGVGSAAIQVARAMGARVTAVTSGGGVSHCHALGSDEVVDRAIVDPMTLGRRFDVYLDCVGVGPLRGHARLLARNGRWVAVAPSVPAFLLTPLSIVISRFLSVPRIAFLVVRPVASDLEELRRLVERGRLRMPVSRTFALEEIRAAHGAPAAGYGKRVLAVSPEALSESSARAAEGVIDAGAA